MNTVLKTFVLKGEAGRLHRRVGPPVHLVGEPLQPQAVCSDRAITDGKVYMVSRVVLKYVSVHNRSFISARKPSYAQKNYLCGFSDS